MASQVYISLGLLVLLCFSLCSAERRFLGSTGVYIHEAEDGKNNAETELLAPHYPVKSSEPLPSHEDGASPPDHGCADSVHPPPPSSHGCANSLSHVTPARSDSELGQGFFKNSQPVTPYGNWLEEPFKPTALPPGHGCADSVHPPPPPPPGHGCADSVHPPPPPPGHGCANNYSKVTPVPPKNELVNSGMGIEVPPPSKY